MPIEHIKNCIKLAKYNMIAIKCLKKKTCALLFDVMIFTTVNAFNFVYTNIRGLG